MGSKIDKRIVPTINPKKTIKKGSNKTVKLLANVSTSYS